MMSEATMIYERKRELMKYIELLMILSKNGINCKQETNQALKELHELMMPKRGVIATDKDKGLYIGKGKVELDYKTEKE